MTLKITQSYSVIHICQTGLTSILANPPQLRFDTCENYSSSHEITVHGVQRELIKNGDADRKSMMLMCWDVEMHRRKVTKSFLEDMFTVRFAKNCTCPKSVV